LENLVIAIEASILAGREILKIYDTSFDVEMKEDRTPLTLADRESHRVITEKLIPTALPVLSEEGKAIPYDERSNWKTFWLVDPLDGTKEFIKRNGEFTVNIALVEGQAAVLGVIYAPVLKKLYFASRESGAWLSTGITDAEVDLERLINISRKLEAGKRSGSFTVVASRSHFSPETEEFVNGLRKEHPDLEFISAGSSMKLCLVADGSANIYPRLGPTMEWDTAAGQAIVECAGGKVLEYKSGQPLRYNKKELLNPWFVVS
jgi:3'(2'), 5'-bisphosphate nucleotidase